MKIQQFVAFTTLLVLLIGCKSEPGQLHKIEAVQQSINDSLTSVQAIEDFVKPFREHVNKDLDSVLAYNRFPMSDKDGEFETAIGNMIADMVVQKANPILLKRTGKSIDFCLVNHGGIRADIAKGNVTKRTAYEVLPFENDIVVVELTAEKVKELTVYLSRAKRAHPISGASLRLNNDYSIDEFLIDGKPLDGSKTYHVATNDYLQNGGDGMVFFADPIQFYDLDYKVRNAMIDYFQEIDTLPHVVDQRFIRKTP